MLKCLGVSSELRQVGLRVHELKSCGLRMRAQELGVQV